MSKNWVDDVKNLANSQTEDFNEEIKDIDKVGLAQNETKEGDAIIDANQGVRDEIIEEIGVKGEIKEKGGVFLLDLNEFNDLPIVGGSNELSTNRVLYIYTSEVLYFEYLFIWLPTRVNSSPLLILEKSSCLKRPQRLAFIPS